MPRLIGFAREKGVSAYIGDGQNRWPGVHRLDAARVYRLALERGVEGGPLSCHRRRGRAVQADRRGDRPAPEYSGGLEVAEEAAEHFGWFAMFASMDVPTSSARTRAKLEWKPEQPGLIADIDHPAYFA